MKIIIFLDDFDYESGIERDELTDLESLAKQMIESGIRPINGDTLLTEENSYNVRSVCASSFDKHGLLIQIFVEK